MACEKQEVYGLGLLVVSVLFVFSSLCPAKTLMLSDEGAWRDIEDMPETQFIRGVMELKRLINTGKVSSAKKLANELRREYPRLSGPQFDDFMRAEYTYASGNYAKAAKAYEQFIQKYPAGWLYESALERHYDIAVAFFQGAKKTVLWVFRVPAFEDGVEIMRKIADRAGDAPLARRALHTLAEYQKKTGRHLDEYETWAEISNRWPTGESGKEAQLGMAFSLHSAYKGPKYDAASLRASRTYYENISQRYPQAADEYAVNNKLEYVEQQRAYKQYNIGEYYDRTDNIRAAKMYYEYVVERWPGSTAGVLAREKLAVLTGQKQPEKPKKDFKRKSFDTAVYFFDEYLGLVNKPLKKVLK